jgi:hypothetical protein
VGSPMKVSGWEICLVEYVDAAQDVPFQWGDHDCATWVADWRKIATGKDAATAWRGKYTTERGALRQIKRAGFETMADWVDSILGDRLPTPLLAQRGDIALVQGALGIVTGAEVVAISPDGLCVFDLSSAETAWRVE